RGRRDGAGAQATAVISAMVMARHFGCRYLHSPFTSMSHNDGERVEWAARWERFFNFGDGEASVSADAELIRLADLVRDPEGYCRRPVVVAEGLFLFPRHSATSVLDALRPALRVKYWRNNKNGIPLHRGPSGGLTVAFHLRRGDVKPEQRRRWVT